MVFHEKQNNGRIEQKEKMSTFKLAFILQVIGKGTIFKSPDKLFFFSN